MRYSDLLISEARLTHKDPVEKWITVFKNSKHPKFKDKTPAQREKMARAAQYRAVQNNSMRIKEGVRMGAKDLAIAPKKDYTVGFEFEVSVNDGYEDSYSSRSDDDYELWEEFQEYWYNNSTFNFSEWFQENYLGRSTRSTVKLQQLLDDIEPIYGRYPTVEEIVEFKNKEEQRTKNFAWENSVLNDTLSEDEKKRLENFILSYKENPYKTLKNLDDFAFVVSVDQQRRYNPYTLDTINERIASILKNSGYDELKNVADRYFMIFSPMVILQKYTADDIDMTKIEYVFDQDGKIVEIDEFTDTDNFLEYFAIDESELQDLTVDEWQEAESYAMDQEFESWAQSRRSSSSAKMGYVSKLISDEFNVKVHSSSGKNHWAVVHESTPGVHAEITSPALSIEDGINAMKRVFKIIQEDDYVYTSQPTGLHINFGTFTEAELSKIDLLKFLMLLQSDRILAEFDRVYNKYAPDQLPKIINSLSSNDISSYINNIRETNQIIRSLSPKFSSLNLSKLNFDTNKIIELRAPGNKGYETKGAYLEQTIRRVVRALELASDPKQYRNEYISMLYKRFGKAKEKKVADPLDSYFRINFGATLYNPSFTLINAISSLDSFMRINDQRPNPDKGYTLQLHQKFMKLLKDEISTTPLTAEEMLRMIDAALEQSDNKNIMKNSRMLKAIIGDLKKMS